MLSRNGMVPCDWTTSRAVVVFSGSPRKERFSPSHRLEGFWQIYIEIRGRKLDIRFKNIWRISCLIKWKNFSSIWWDLHDSHLFLFTIIVVTNFGNSLWFGYHKVQNLLSFWVSHIRKCYICIAHVVALTIVLTFLLQLYMILIVPLYNYCFSNYGSSLEIAHATAFLFTNLAVCLSLCNELESKRRMTRRTNKMSSTWEW